MERKDNSPIGTKQASVEGGKVEAKSGTSPPYPYRSKTKKERPRNAKRHVNANISMRPYVVRDPAEGKSFLSSRDHRPLSWIERVRSGCRLSVHVVQKQKFVPC